MTLRDLTPRQLYNLQRRCEKEHKELVKKRGTELNEATVWILAYDKGLKAGLSLCPGPTQSTPEA